MAAMEFLAAINPLSVASGFCVGLLVGLTGVGGGSLMTPLLILLFGTTATTAVGTDLLYAAVTKSAGSITHSLKQNVNWRIVALLAAGSLPGSLLAVVVLYLAGASGNTSPRFVTITLGVALLLSAAAVVSRRRIRRWINFHGGPAPRWTPPLTVLAGLLLGVLVTVSSVGAGALGMAMLVSLYPAIPLARLVGTDVAHAVPLTLLAGIGHLLLGDISWLLLLSLLIGSVPGIVLGSHLSARLPEQILRPILALILVAVGIRMLRG